MKVLKDERGFSFVEMLTTSVILCFMIIVSYPVLMLVTKKSKENLYKQNIKEIERAAITWAIGHITDLPNDSSDARFKTIKELKEDNLIQNEYIYDPRNDKLLNGCIMIIKNADNQYKATYKETSCEKLGKKYVPTIKVVKEPAKTYEVNSTNEYELPTLIAQTVRGDNIEVPYPEIKKNGKKVTYIDSTNVGDKYDVVYKITDNVNGLISKYSFTVKIVDNKSPIITVLGQTKGFEEEIVLGEKYEIPRAFVTDNSNKKVDLKVSTNLNTNLLGNYEVVYTATDSNDNLGLLLIKVKVVENNLSEQNKIIISNMEALPGDGSLKKINNNEYIFVGANPNNYLKFNNELWRIIKLDSNGIKVVKLASSQSMPWSKNSTTSMDYSQVLSNLANYSMDLPEDEVKFINKRVKWNTGSISEVNLMDISLKRYESSLQWQGASGVGLLNISDYKLASLSSSCSNNINSCKDKNYLSILKNAWTLNSVEKENKMYVVGSNGITTMSVSTSNNVHPVLYLKGYKSIKGNGSKNDPYQLVK